MISRLLDLWRIVPSPGKIGCFATLICTSLFWVYYRFGLLPAVVAFVGYVLLFLGSFTFQRMQQRRERQQGLQFGKALSESHGPSSAELKLRVGELDTRFQNALTTLKEHDVEIYHLPWYVTLGEPGCGKSSALRRSSLKFPIGLEEISGTGGTKNCDWWFTDQGVFLDTAGRYTFPDTSYTDPHEWTRFLELLGKHRPYSPINGVIVMIPADSLLQDDSKTIEAKARSIHERLSEIQRTLAISFPVYVMISKCDLVYGFSEFFQDLPAEEQQNMLGWSSPDEKYGFSTDTFRRAFDDLRQRIRYRRLKCFSERSNLAPASFVFHEEFAMLRQPLEDYLNVLFRDNFYREPLMFRGFYFSSACQEGYPLGIATRELNLQTANALDLSQRFPKQRAFFIRDFYSDKVLPEEGLVTRAFQKKENDKRKFIGLVNIALIALGLLFVSFTWRSLDQKLKTPSLAIQTATDDLKAMGTSTFFASEERGMVYQNLRNIRASLGTSPTFLFRKHTGRALNAHLEDSFSIIYLDRFLLEFFDRVDQQLRNFQLPQSSGDSREDLEVLCRALSNYCEWRKHVRTLGSDIEPDIGPFLGMFPDSQWDVGGPTSAKEDLRYWFRITYQQSSPQLRRLMIERLTERDEDLFSELHQKVHDFYKNQPGADTLTEKKEMVDQLQSAWTTLEQSPKKLTDYQRYYDRVNTFFRDNQFASLTTAAPPMLTYDAIQNRILDALGEPYISLAHTIPDSNSVFSETVDKDILDFARKLVKSP